MTPQSPTAQLRTAIQDVRAFCASKRCKGTFSAAAECTDLGCFLYKWRRKPEQAGDLFQPLKDEFFSRALVFAQLFFDRPRWWDDYIKAWLEHWGGQPHDKSWIGQLAMHLRRHGFGPTTESRPSRLKAANRRRIYVWEICHGAFASEAQGDFEQAQITARENNAATSVVLTDSWRYQESKVQL